MKERREAHLSERKRFNWLDWAIVGAVAVGLVGAFLIFCVIVGSSDGERGELFYTVLISNVDEGLFGAEETGALSLGVPVKSANGTVTLGEVTSWHREPHRQAVVRDGALTWLELPEHFDYYVTVRSEAHRKAGDGIRVGDIRIAAGMPVSLRVGRFFAQNSEIVWVGWESNE